MLVSYGIAGDRDSRQASPRGSAGAGATSAPATRSAAGGASPEAARPVSTPSPDSPQLPQGGRTIFPGYRVVAYYGTAGTGALGVLGSQPPGQIVRRLRRAAGAYDTPNRKVQMAFELIVTIADSYPGPDGDYRHAIDRSKVRRYVRVARRNDALVVLDIQPGRGDFLSAVQHWREFLEQPNVGLALDPEWHMAPDEVPAETIGQVHADEVNKVSAYLSEIVRKHRLPQKLFILHTFRDSMLRAVDEIESRPGLAVVEHIDGFGVRKDKREIYRKLRRPQRFHMGFKLFYEQDVDVLAPDEVLDLDPPPEYISYQ